MKKYYKIVFIFMVTLIAIHILFRFIEDPLFNITAFDKDIINFYANYEFSTIIISVLFLIVLFFTADKIRLKYLNIFKMDGEVKAVPLIGLKPKQGEGWKKVGLNIGVIITVVTGIIVYFQIVDSSGLTIRLFPEIPLILLFALMNSFTEEVVFRLSYATIVANEKMTSKLSEFLGGGVFGVVHYFGLAPNGIFGASMAIFLGWFLTKSINETKGFFWAWSIHFLQDVVIIFFLFMAN